MTLQPVRSGPTNLWQPQRALNARDNDLIERLSPIAFGTKILLKLPILISMILKIGLNM